LTSASPNGVRLGATPSASASSAWNAGMLAS
jgi:hypothetical protein